MRNTGFRRTCNFGYVFYAELFVLKQGVHYANPAGIGKGREKLCKFLRRIVGQHSSFII